MPLSRLRESESAGVRAPCPLSRLRERAGVRAEVGPRLKAEAGARRAAADAGTVRWRIPGQARRSEISPARKRARRGPSASTSAPVLSTPATVPLTLAPSGSSSFTGFP